MVNFTEIICRINTNWKEEWKYSDYIRGMIKGLWKNKVPDQKIKEVVDGIIEKLESNSNLDREKEFITKFASHPICKGLDLKVIKEKWVKCEKESEMLLKELNVK